MTSTDCPILWPEADTHVVEYAALEPTVPADLQGVVAPARQLAKLGDALRSLQTADGSPISAEASRELASSSARLMHDLAGSAQVPPEMAEIIRRRAEALVNGTPTEPIAREEAALTTPQPLTVLCGPLCTWRMKTKTALHAVIVATRHEASDRLMAGLDASSADALNRIGARLGLADLSVGGVYPIQVVDLIACGGEANAFPKHFGYFLPEDEGVVDRATRQKKTILFRNAYKLRYTRISDRIAESLLAGPRLGADADVARLLITWLRGHDIAHAVTLPGANRIGPEDVGHEPYFALQEAISDVFGFLLAVSPEWLELLGQSADDVCAIFMGELLHYLRRGPWLWGDAYAAFLELSFLERHGFVTIDADARIHWETERLIAGMDALAATLAGDVVTAPDAAPVLALLDEHSWERNSGAVRVVEALRTQLGAVPTALAYA
jgi:hypothetical protein